ncbi:MAG: hypothetical protein QXS69_02805 [Candidatus Aenigmatarchaeota archaeon]
MAIRHITKKIKLGKIAKKSKNAPIWASIKKYGLKRARSRRIRPYIETNWRRKRIKT